MNIAVTTSVVVSQEIANMAQELTNIRGFIAQMKKREDEIKKSILAEVKLGETGFFAGQKVVKVAERNNVGIDRALLKDNFPEAYEAVLTHSVSPVVTV